MVMGTVRLREVVYKYLYRFARKAQPIAPANPRNLFQNVAGVPVSVFSKDQQR